MIPVVTPEEMRAIDAAAAEDTQVLIRRAANAAAEVALQMLGETSTKSVVVIAGNGNNGADGRECAAILRDRGLQVEVFDAQDAPRRIDGVDLVIDAAFGTGFHGSYQAPESDAPVLAIDIPSGVDGLTGKACQGAVQATRTVTFAALKPGLLLGEGRTRAGDVTPRDISLDVTGCRINVVEDSDVRRAIAAQPQETHKWKSALSVVAGSPGMMGAAMFSTRAAQRCGSGMVRLASPGVAADQLPIGEAVAVDASADDWAVEILEDMLRSRAAVVGPGLGRSENTSRNVLKLVEQFDGPLLLDADGLWAVSNEGGLQTLAKRGAPTVLTPHDKEFERLAGKEVGEDRIAAARELAAKTCATVLLKGSTTVVADPSGQVLLSIHGSARLGTAGTGDVLSGVTGALLAQGLSGLQAGALGAHIHQMAALRGRKRGLIASDLPELIADYLSEVCE